MSRIAGAAAAALLAACVPEDGPLMEPGEDCLECHTGGEAPRFTVAGTRGRDSVVSIVDANGKSLTLRTARNGNFYTAERLTFPLTVSVDGLLMPHPVPPPDTPAGTCLDPVRCCVGARCGCNDCHGNAHGGH